MGIKKYVSRSGFQIIPSVTTWSVLISLLLQWDACSQSSPWLAWGVRIDCNSFMCGMQNIL